MFPHVAGQGTATVSDDDNIDLTGSVGSVACQAVDTLACLPTFLGRGTKDFSGENGLTGESRPERSPTGGPGYLAIGRGFA